MNDIRNKRVVVIGGSSGIGYEVARQTAALGAELTIVGRNPAKVGAAADKLGGTVTTTVLATLPIRMITPPLDSHDEALRGLEGLKAERDAIVALARQQKISDATSRKLGREIDLLEARHR